MTEQITSESSDEIKIHAEASATMPGPSEYDGDEHADDAEIVRQLKRGGPNVSSSAFEPIEVNERTAAVAPVITGEFINMTIRSLRAPFDAKKKRGAEFKGARARLDKRADQAVREFRAMYLPEISDEQALRISLGITGLVGDSMRGFTYVDSSEE